MIKPFKNIFIHKMCFIYLCHLVFADSTIVIRIKNKLHVMSLKYGNRINALSLLLSSLQTTMLIPAMEGLHSAWKIVVKVMENLE